MSSSSLTYWYNIYFFSICIFCIIVILKIKFDFYVDLKDLVKVILTQFKIRENLGLFEWSFKFTQKRFLTSINFDNFDNSESETKKKHYKRDVWFNSRPYVLNNHINLSPNLDWSETKFAYQFSFIRGDSKLPICPTGKHWLNRLRRSHLYSMFFSFKNISMKIKSTLKADH